MTSFKKQPTRKGTYILIYALIHIAFWFLRQSKDSRRAFGCVIMIFWSLYTPSKNEKLAYPENPPLNHDLRESWISQHPSYGNPFFNHVIIESLSLPSSHSFAHPHVKTSSNLPAHAQISCKIPDKNGI